MEEVFDCPRKAEAMMSVQREHKTHWRTGREGRTCSYCGSLHPEDFFVAIEAGCQIGPTDKNYKVYVDLPNPDVGKPCIHASANFEQTGEGWVQITAENRGSLPLDDWHGKNWQDGHWVKVEPDGPKVHGKFYFQHLSREEQQRFIDLLYTKKVNIGYPGHFYVTPFFITYGKPES